MKVYNRYLAMTMMLVVGFVLQGFVKGIFTRCVDDETKREYNLVGSLVTLFSQPKQLHVSKIKAAYNKVQALAEK